MPYSSFLSTEIPKFSAISLNRPTQAFRSDVQLLQCTMATASPDGVVTRSSSSWTAFNASFNTTMAKTEVPADTLPVPSLTELVAVIPVPASPSGGQSGIPASSSPVGSSSFAPSSVRTPAFSPAFRTFGRIWRNFHGYPLVSIRSSKISTRFSS